MVSLKFERMSLRPCNIGLQQNWVQITDGEVSVNKEGVVEIVLHTLGWGYVVIHGIAEDALALGDKLVVASEEILDWEAAAALSGSDGEA